MTSDETIRAASRRIMGARARLLCRAPFYARLLMRLEPILTEAVQTAGTDGARLWVSPTFVTVLDERELEYVLMHLACHVALLACDDSLQACDELANRARDLIVNSCVLAAADGDTKAITLRCCGGIQEHQTPNGREGRDLTCAEARRLLSWRSRSVGSTPSGWDWHPRPEQCSDVPTPSDLRNIAMALGRETRGRQGPDGEVRGTWAGSVSVPICLTRRLDAISRGRADWRLLLGNALSGPEDYDFCPPDRRSPAPFLLPFASDVGGSPRDVLFMVDSSASMTDSALAEALAEVREAMDQFGHALAGWVSFFDTEVTRPVPFESMEDVQRARPSGRGGTSFHAALSYLRQHRGEIDPAVIVFLTDGMAPFPSEDEADGVPVVWALNNDVVEPPWGRVGRTGPPRNRC